MRGSLEFLVLSGCLVFATLMPAAGQDKPPPATSSVSNSPATNTLKERKTEIRFKDDKLTVKGKDFPLELIAEELTHKAGIAVLMTNDVAAQLVSADLENLPVDQALRRILRKQDVFFFYGVDEDQPSALKAVWIYPKGRGRGLAPVPPEKWASTRDVSASLTDKDPAMRGRAIETLVERKGAASKEALVGALNDSDSQVRARALYAALKSGVELPQPVLSDMLHDSSADVRFLALQTVSNGPEARSAAQAALNDSNEAVRTEAQTIIGRLDEAADQSQPGRRRVPTGQEGEEPR
jgi:HEAT repeat protein